jgi:ketosteroid isomerase-like protein
MKQTIAESKAEIMDHKTLEVVNRFNSAFHEHDSSALQSLVDEHCVLENTAPAPDGARYVGRAAVLAFWGALADTPHINFEVENIFVAGEQAIIRWRLRSSEGDGYTVRGVNLTRVRNGLIVESLGYVKG